ncbi:PDZ domain-containing protein [Clostridiaceae bacterium UIB06]|nr:PDZ domain-containing protein [Clostridiaceae bacterium UIB06]
MKNKCYITEDKINIDKTYIKKYRLFNIFSVLIFLAFFISSFSLNVQAAESSSLLNEARNIIKENYVTTVPDSVLNASTIEGMVKGLNDPYSQYFSEKEGQDFVNAIDNKMYGIGIHIGMVAEGVKVQDVIETSPAEKAGILKDDIIISADGQSLAGLDASKASSYIKGEDGTNVALKVKRGDSLLDFTVQRGEISVPTVTGKMLNDHTAYIKISSFGEDTGDLFTQKLKELRMKNPDNYIVDLTDNGGGYMLTALDIAGHFIGENPAIVIEDRDGEKTTYPASDKGSTIDKPVIFLINKYTASASEILSAAVKDYKKAIFVGTTTYGKGVAQQMFPLSDGSMIKLTVEKFYSPKEKVIQKVGISPDFEVKEESKVDSLAVAELFFGKCRNDVDKRGYVKVNVEGNDYEIDLNLAKDENHWAAFKYIISKASKDKTYIGTENGWVKATSDYFDNIYKFLYGKYKSLDTLKDVPENKVFTITFNKSVNADTIKDNTSMEIINAETGQRAAFDVKKIDDKKISLTPHENLIKGQTYYIKIKDVIKPFTVKQ